ncbi:MAG: tetratricopeptide repeat protein [Bacteroidales bacterium]|nr:tetratricopeptide repeat protein [Bacteroidales bacterium]MBR0083894.1 tetratricopeptide repeat protein [Bacteroidales bacterium]
MKKIFVSLAALFAAAAMMSAQSMADATETAKLANESLSAGEYQTALEGFKEALKMAEACGEDGLELVATCKDIIPKTLNAIAKDLLKDKNYDEALAKFSETVAVAREYGDDETAAKAEELIPQIYMQKGGSLLNAKDFAGAAEAYKKAVELDPDNGIALLRLGMALDGADRDDEAVEAYKAAAAAGQEKNANAQLGKFYLKRSVASLKAKKYADAVKDAVTSNEYVANPQALQVAGQASQLSGKNADAIKYFEQYLEAAPNAKNAGQIAYTVGALYQQAKNNAKAKEYFSKATSDPKFGADAQKALNSLK